MQRKLFSDLEKFNYKKLTPVIEFINNNSSAKIQSLFLPRCTPEIGIKKIMEIRLTSPEEFRGLKKIALEETAIKQKTALGILVANSNNPVVKNFFADKLNATPIAWNNFNDQIITDRFHNKYLVSIYNVAPLVYYTYLTPQKRTLVSEPHAYQDVDNKSFGLSLPYDLAGRFIFSTAPDNYGYFPELSKKKKLTIPELKFLVENTALPKSDIASSFSGLKLYKRFAKLCYKILPPNTRLFLTDIVETATLSQLNNGDPFETTLFGKSFLGAGFNFIGQTPYIKPNYPERRTWYGIELLKEAAPNNRP